MIQPDRAGRTLARIAAVAALCVSALSPTATAGDPPRLPRPTEVLEKAWPGHPEWVAMFVDILQGSRLGPRDGWFKKGVARTRFGWEPTRSRLDGDGDGTISRAEFPGIDADFARLDRDRDGGLSKADFDHSPHALTPSVGTSVFFRADRDGDGKVSPDELQSFFRSMSGDDSDFLSLDELRQGFKPPTPGPRPASAGNPEDRGPSKATLVKALFRQELGSLRAGPGLDEAAPDFTLRTVDGKEEVTLSKLVGPKPVVLVFGNFTCGPFRSQAGNVEKLHRRYKDRATFVMVYVREAHPTDGWHADDDDPSGVNVRQPRDYAERVGVARACSRRLGLGFPMLVDTIDDAVGGRYSGMPGRLYLIDGRGKVAYKSGRGPFGFKVAELEQSLILLLTRKADEGKAARVPAPGEDAARKGTPPVESKVSVVK